MFTLCYIKDNVDFRMKTYSDKTLANRDAAILLKHKLPVMAFEYDSQTRSEPKFYNCKKQWFLCHVAKSGYSFDIDCTDESYICDLVLNGRPFGADHMYINGEAFLITEHDIRQDEQWAAVYNSYGGNEDVHIITLYLESNSDVYTEFWYGM